MKKKFVEPIKDRMFSWVAPDGSIQLTMLAPDLATMLGFTKLLSQNNISQSAKDMLNKGFTIHQMDVDIKDAGQVKMNGELMAQVINL